MKTEMLKNLELALEDILAMSDEELREGIDDSNNDYFFTELAQVEREFLFHRVYTAQRAPVFPRTYKTIQKDEEFVEILDSNPHCQDQDEYLWAA